MWIASNTTTSVPWGSELFQRWGAEDRLCGIRVFHDFQWLELFNDERTQFKNGKQLAQLIIKHCPTEKSPALLLTRNSEVAEGVHDHEDYHLIVINIDNYKKHAFGNAATTYFSKLSSVDPCSISQTELLAKLDMNTVTAWLEADPDRVRCLSSVIKEVDGGLREIITGREIETAQALVELLGTNAWQMLENAGAELPDLLVHRRVWQQRRRQVEEFREHLACGDWTEPDWQRFFEEKTWIFGYGLCYHFLHMIQDHPYTGGRDVTRSGGQEGDMMMSTAGIVRFTVLVEIKTPGADLVGKLYRNRVNQIGEDLAGGVVQLQQQCSRWATEGSRTDENRDLLENQDIYTHEPRGILVIGDLSSVAEDRAKLKVFESFRRNLVQPEVLTFDELLDRAEHIVSVGESETDAAVVDPCPT